MFRIHASASLPSTLDPVSERRALSFSVLDGVCYALMVGLGETYFVADAIRLHASALQLGLVTSLPLLVGALGPLLVLRILLRFRRRKPLVVSAALGQAIVLLAIAAFDAARTQTASSLIGAACLYQTCGQAAGTAWSSWYGDLVPAAIRGRYFARRTRLMHLMTFLALVLAGVLLNVLEPTPGQGGGGRGFQLVFALAGVMRLCSAVFLGLSPEARFHGLPGPEKVVRFLRTGRGSNARRLVLGGAAFQVLVYVSAPYYGPYMLQGLRFDYFTYMVAISSQVAVKVLAMPFWGRAVDRHGPLRVYATTMVVAAVVPLPWLWASGLPWVLFSQLVSGAAWGGYEVALFALMLDSSLKRTRPLVFAAQSICNGFGQLSGGLIGAAVAGGSGGFVACFAVSLVGRVAVSMVVPSLIRERRATPTPRREPLLLRIIGFRPGAGLNHRPIFDPVAAAPPKAGDAPP